jgi:hypothetical protein
MEFANKVQESNLTDENIVMVLPSEEAIYCGDCDPEQQEKLPPVERVVRPKDVVEIKEDDESVYVIGTRDGKVTVIDGLDDMKVLKVRILS